MAQLKTCTNCKGEMKLTSKHWVQAKRGNIAGWNVYTYTCTKCGKTHEENFAVD